MPPLTQFLELRRRPAGPPPEGPGRGSCLLLSEALDRALTELAAGEVTVIAVGGYGRRELAPHSDVDVMLLGAPSEEQVRRVLYPLWDARLRVGHSVRTVREALAAARDRIDTLCSLLTSRLVTGDLELLGELERGLAGLLRRERARFDRVLAEEERERRRREPYHRQAVDLKNGRGGLRCFHAADWQRRRAILLGETALGELSGEEEAREALRAARNALHWISGRAQDLFAHEMWPAVAEWLGGDPVAVAQAVLRAVRVGDRLGRIWMSVPEQLDPVAAAGRRVSGAFRRRPSPGRADSPALTVAVRALGRSPVTLSAGEEQLLASGPAPTWTPADREALLTVVTAGAAGWEVLDHLVESGWLQRSVPEWQRVLGRPQVAPFHEHPVDVHLWRTAQEVIEVTGPDSVEPWCREVADDLGSLDEVLLAALLHDIGKGLPGDHSEAGASAALEVLPRLGFGPGTARTVATAIRHHLLLPRAATRLDPDDATVIAAVAAAVGDLATLRLLFLLTVGDGRATGAEVWSPWRASLVRSVFAKTAEYLAARRGARRAPVEGDVIAAVSESVGIPPVAVRRHADGMPPGYLLRFGAEAVAGHLRLSDPPLQADEIRLGVRPGAPLSHADVAARDRPGLLATVCGVLALHRISVRDARVATRDDGLVLDAFTVEDGLGTGMIGPARWPAVRTDLVAAVRGGLDLEQQIAAKAATYRSGPAVGVEVTVRTGYSGRGTVEIRCADRVGLLFDICRALADLGLDVHLAAIDTLAGRAVDVFHLRRLDPERADEVRTALTARLGR